MVRRILSDSQWARVALLLPGKDILDDPQETIGSSSTRRGFSEPPRSFR